MSRAKACTPAQMTRTLRRTVQPSGARADVSDLLRTTMRHPVTGRRIYLSARDRTTLERRRAYLEDVRRELGTAAHCPHCGGDLGTSRLTEAEASELFERATEQNARRESSRLVRLLRAIEAQIATRPPIYQRQARSVLRNQFAPYFGKDARVMELTIPRVRAWLSALERDGYSAKTRRDAFDMLCASYKRLAAGRVVPERPPWHGMPRPKAPARPESRRTPPTRAEFLRLMRAIAERSPERARLVLFAALTGLRNGELVALAWDDWDGADVLTVRHSAPDHWRKFTREERPRFPTKGRREAIQTLHPQARAVLEQQRADLERRGHFRPDGAIWPDAGGAFRPNNNALRPETIQRDAARAGIGKVSAHTLRHLTATLEAEGGAKAVEIGARLRHRDLQTSEGYIHQRRGAPSRIEPLAVEIPADRPTPKK